MKYNIHGFYQPRAVELGLTNDDLLVLRWFVDYSGTGKMRTIIIENRVYYWINYNTVLEELPVLKVSKQTLYKKHFMNLVNAQVLDHKHIKEDGSFSYYCYGINYETLIYLEGGYVKNTDPMSKFTEGGMSKFTDPLCKNLRNKDYNNNINNSTIINNRCVNTQTPKKFIRPTLDEVKAYCQERRNRVDAERFIDFYESKGWKVGNQAMKDWKACVRTWEKRDSGKKEDWEKENNTKVNLNDLYSDLDDMKW